jgi:hypothetical protein
MRHRQGRLAVVVLSIIYSSTIAIDLDTSLTDEERAIFARADSAAGAGTTLSTCDTVRFLVNNYGRQLLVRVGASDSVTTRAAEFCTRQVRLPENVGSDERADQSQQCISYIKKTTLRWRDIVANAASCVLELTAASSKSPIAEQGAGILDRARSEPQNLPPSCSCNTSGGHLHTLEPPKLPYCPVSTGRNQSSRRMRIYVYDMPARFLRGYDRLQHQTDM